MEKSFYLPYSLYEPYAYPVQTSQGKWGRGGVPRSVLLGFLFPVRGCVEPSITLGTSGCWK